MKLKNKKTGEMGDLTIDKGFLVAKTGTAWAHYSSLAELNKEWEDVPEEPKEWWYIDIHGPHEVTTNDEYYQQVKAASKEFGNYFETKEEAELAVRKLKAWKRLRDKGFRFHDWKKTATYCLPYEWSEDVKLHEIDKDLDLLFGGEE